MFPYLEQIKKLFTLGNVATAGCVGLFLYIINPGISLDSLFESKDDEDEMPQVIADLVVREARIWTGNQYRP